MMLLQLAGSLMAAMSNLSFAAPQLAMEIRPIVAIESGPIVFEATLRNQGLRTLIVGQFQRDKLLNVQFALPNDPRLPAYRDGILPIRHDVKLTPGEKLTEYLYIHHFPRYVAKNRSLLEISWSGEYCSLEGKLRTTKRRTFVVEGKVALRLLAKSPKNIAGVEQQYWNLLLAGANDPRLRRHALNWLMGLKCSDFLLFHLMFFDTATSQLDEDDAARLLKENGLSFDRHFRDLLMSQAERAVVLPSLFSMQLERNNCQPTPREFDKMLAAPNPWVRVFAVAAFPKKIQNEQAQAVIAHIRTHLSPQPSKIFLTLLADLDNPRFQVREEATKKLAQMGERVEYMIIRALDNSPSAEAKQRLERALHEMVTADPIPESFRVIRALKRIESPEAKEFLKIIADGPPGLRSTREAKKAK